MPLPPFRTTLALAGLSWLAGCAAASGARAPAMHAERTTPAMAQVSDDAFASAVRDLLMSQPASAERTVRLGAVEARQMIRAEARFRAHAPERGLAAVSGALLLIRTGEGVRNVVGPQGVDALRSAARELALRGDEGRSQALYDLLAQIVPEADRKELRDHLEALRQWKHDVLAAQGPLASAGGLERIAVRRRLLEPSAEALGEAATVTTDWIAQAVALRDKFRKTRTQPPREEGAEAWRALETGPAVLASLYLRDANPAGALAQLGRAQARDLLESERPQFAAALEAAARENSLDRCLDLLRQLRPLSGREAAREDEDFIEDRDLFAAAAFGVASECYRLDPTVPEVALALGVALEELGMAEATPAVLVDVVRSHPEARVTSEALSLALDAMATEEDAGEPESARRVFRAAQPLLETASQKSLVGKVHPSPARMRAAMGEIELREGKIDAARALLRQSADEEPSGSVLLSLARIEWRDGQVQSALDRLRSALVAQDVAQDPALKGEILLTISDVTREKGDVVAARTPLTEALRELIGSRNRQEADSRARARVERILARVLDRFGAALPAQRALERAYAAAPGDKHQATQTIELLVGRAFVRGDLAAAREGLQRALTADLDDDDLVYFALWVRLVERQLRLPTDGLPDRVFSAVPDDGRWVATLAHFGEGKVKGDELLVHAKTPIQKYEALFYAAIDRKAAGDTKGGDELLRQVVAGTGLELSEVALARDMLDPTKSQIGGPLPPDLAIP
jgi:tetratricopeptide (TPR) repeat protein